MNRLFELAITTAAAGVVLYLVWCLVELATHPEVYP